jgi:hypothetical protein
MRVHFACAAAAVVAVYLYVCTAPMGRVRVWRWERGKAVQKNKRVDILA